MKNILVTGGAGFIGSHVAEFYANQEYTDNIYIIDNLSRDRLLNKEIKFIRYNWDYLHKFNKIQFLEEDIRNFEFLKKFFKQNEIDGVIHTAAQTAVTSSINNPISDFENNVIGTFNLLESIRISKSDPISLFCSTNKVFGDNINKCEVIEKDLRYDFTEQFSNGISEEFSIDLCEHTPYGASKLCSDIYFQEYARLYGLKTAVFRMSCIYGPRQFGVEDQGWVAHFIISALTNKKLKIFGDGKQVRDILYISDLIEAYDSFFRKADSIKHDIFCMGGGIDNTISLLELIEILKKELNKEIEYDFYDWRPSDQKIYISDIHKAQKLLNWNPKIKSKVGIKNLIKWAKNNIKLLT
ncbi:MAG: GDP-mannose 4,6-dehydratase [Promethearchaeota archaeon]